MKLIKSLAIFLVLLLLFSLTMGNSLLTKAATDSTQPVVESISVDKSQATTSDTVKLSVKLKGTIVVNYIDAWYVSPVTNSSIHVNLYYNSETGSFEGSFPVLATSESGNYHLTRLTFYEPDNIAADLMQSDLFQNGDFSVSGTNASLLQSISVDKSEATAGDTVNLSVKLTDPSGVGVIDAWYTAPITRAEIHVSLSYNSETGLFEGSFPVRSSTEAGDYHLWRLVFYGGSTIDLMQSDLFENGDFTANGTSQEGLIESLSVNKKETTAGDVQKFDLKVTDPEGINYILLWLTSPTYKTIYQNLYYNDETGTFEGNLPIDSSFESGDYHINRATISAGFSYDYFDDGSKLGNGGFSVFPDQTPPVTSINLDSSNMKNGDGYNSNVTVSLRATDDQSGVKQTFYRVNNGDWTPYTQSFELNKEGTFAIEYKSVDQAGNEETAKSTVVKIDKTAPVPPTVNEVTNRSTSITGTAEAGSTVTVKTGTTELGTVEAGTDGKFSVTIPKQADGTEIIVTATDKAGNTSEAATVIVKKETVYKQLESKTNVDLHYDFTVKLNNNLDVATVTSSNIYMKTNSTIVQGVKVSLNADKRSIKVEAPEAGYKAGETYVIYVEKAVKSASGKELKEPVKMQFTVTENNQ